MIIVKLLTMAVIGAIIGYATNVIAVKLLFRPLKPINILGFQLQGLIPKRHEEIVKSVADTIEKELIDINQVFDEVIDKIDKKSVLKLFEDKIAKIIVDNLPPLMLAFKTSILGYLHEMIEKEGEIILTEVTEQLVHKATTSISIKDLVEERLMSYDLQKIESIILSLASKELGQIETLGGVIGFVVGLIQGGIVVLFFN